MLCASALEPTVKAFGHSLYMRAPFDTKRTPRTSIDSKKMSLNQGHKFCVAPMMEWTDRHCRFFHRLLTRRARLYTEMLGTGAVIHGDRARLLAFDPAEHQLAGPLGGFAPRALA